jgi:serine/threonine-protein kinase
MAPARGRSGRAGAWPWVALAAAILIVAWLLAQGLSRAPDQGTAIEATSTIVVPPSALRTVAPEITPVDVANVAGETTVPDVVGHGEVPGVRRLADVGYQVTEIEVFSGSVADGRIIAQTPSAGSSAATGATISLVVSKGRKLVAQVTMPSVVGLTRKQAETRIRAAGLVPYVMYGVDPQRIGRVISQWPDPESRVPEGNEGFIQISLK